jgi:hypothetical protein
MSETDRKKKLTKNDLVTIMNFALRAIEKLESELEPACRMLSNRLDCSLKSSLLASIDRYDENIMKIYYICKSEIDRIRKEDK